MFDADVTAVMGQAFDFVITQLRDTGQPDLVQEIIAQRIVEIAAHGERNPTRMADIASETLGLRRKAM